MPAEFSHRIGLTSHQRAADYTGGARQAGHAASAPHDAILLVCLTLMGGLQFIDLMVGQLTSNDFCARCCCWWWWRCVLGLLGATL